MKKLSFLLLSILMFSSHAANDQRRLFVVRNRSSNDVPKDPVESSLKDITINEKSIRWTPSDTTCLIYAYQNPQTVLLTVVDMEKIPDGRELPNLSRLNKFEFDRKTILTALVTGKINDLVDTITVSPSLASKLPYYKTQIKAALNQKPFASSADVRAFCEKIKDR